MLDQPTCQEAVLAEGARVVRVESVEFPDGLWFALEVGDVRDS